MKPMLKRDLEDLVEQLHKEATVRQALGGYSAEAPVMAFIVEKMSELAQHMLVLRTMVLSHEQMYRRKKKKEKAE